MSSNATVARATSSRGRPGPRARPGAGGVARRDRQRCSPRASLAGPQQLLVGQPARDGAVAAHNVAWSDHPQVRRAPGIVPVRCTTNRSGAPAAPAAGERQRGQRGRAAARSLSSHHLDGATSARVPAAAQRGAGRIAAGRPGRRRRTGCASRKRSQRVAGAAPARPGRRRARRTTTPVLEVQRAARPRPAATSSPPSTTLASSAGSPSGCGWNRRCPAPAPARCRPEPRSGVIMLGSRRPGGWRWKPSGLRSCSPSQLLRCIPVPGTTIPDPSPLEQVTAQARPWPSITDTWVVAPGPRAAKRSANPASERPSGTRACARPEPGPWRRRVAPGVDPGALAVQQRQRVGDQHAARRGRRVGQDLAVAVADSQRRGGRSRDSRPDPRR